MAATAHDRRRPPACRTGALVVAGLLVAALLAGCSEQAADTTTTLPTAKGGTGGVAPGKGDGTTVLSMFKGERWFDGDVPAPAKADPAQPPVKVGFVSVDAGPIGAMPELHTATDAAVAVKP